ncbi:SDR family oxidoreductase, partial [Raoultella ornithinolytica]|uniref:SDR family oxidoreductase n=1 Tax=Raoultella ornithinolytica TaxID=54291 RepID=UPI003F1B7F72
MLSVSVIYYLNAVYFCAPTIRLINHNETVLMKMLLITGVTGFLGGAVLEKILTNAQSVELLLLARAGDPQSGLERVLENMR